VRASKNIKGGKEGEEIKKWAVNIYYY